MSEWQPIETAPKDGSHFLGAEFWDNKWWYEEIWYSHTWEFGGGSFLAKPSHWMPLPPCSAPATGARWAGGFPSIRPDQQFSRASMTSSIR